MTAVGPADLTGPGGAEVGEAGARVAGPGGSESGLGEDAADLALVRACVAVSSTVTGIIGLKGVILRRNLLFRWVGARLPCIRTM